MTAYANRRIRAVFDPLTNRPVTLAGIAANYDLIDEENDTLTDIGDVIITQDGTMSGSVTDETQNTCAVTGNISHVTPSQNIFAFTMALSGSCLFPGTYSGHAAQYDDADRGITNALAMIFGGQQAAVQVELIRQGQINP